MRKRGIIFIICFALMLGCSPLKGIIGRSKTESSAPETTTVRLALNDSGHILNAIAESQGYLREEGITVTYVRVKTDVEAFEGLRTGRIDVLSNSGTNLPLQYLADGIDLTIFGGYLLSGCLPIIGKADTEWNGIDDLIGKTMACEPNMYAVTGPLRDKGYDPLNQITWYNPEDQMDRIRAVENGDADFALVGTPLNYEVITNPNIKILTYANDILPDYSCCRVEALSSWVHENPNTVKALLRAWIRALAYYNEHHDEAVALVGKLVSKDEAFVRAYLDNPRFNLNTDPMKTSVVRAWRYLTALGLLSGKAQTTEITDHVNTTLYKEALDECQERYGSDNPKFYEKMQAQYAKNNQ